LMAHPRTATCAVRPGAWCVTGSTPTAGLVLGVRGSIAMERNSQHVESHSGPVVLPTSSDLSPRWVGRRRDPGGEGRSDGDLRGLGPRCGGDHRRQGDVQGELDQSQLTIDIGVPEATRHGSGSGHPRLAQSGAQRAPRAQPVLLAQRLRRAQPAHWSRGRHNADRGSVVIEAVLVIPVIMLILLAVVQFALWSHASQVAQLAASEGDRAARSMGGGTAAGISRAQWVLQGAGSDLERSSATAAVLPGDQVRLTVVGRALSILPGLSLPVSATVIGPVQEFRTSG
jgi:hypothetical protein